MTTTTAPPAASVATTPAVRLRDRALARSLPLMPRRLVRRFSAPYIAGEDLDAAMSVVRSLQRDGLASTIDVLGEAITRREQAIQTRDAYLQTLDRLAGIEDPDMRNVSVKLTALGLAIEDGLALDLTRQIALRAREIEGFVRIDMEDSPWTDATLELYRTLRSDGLDNVGVVIQSYLRRSARDVAMLAAEGARVRLVKGIYLEPSDIAYQEMSEVNASFLDLARTLADAGCHVAFATHDEALVRGCEQIVEDLSLPRDRHEFQMLLGVREPLRDQVRARGHHVRVYVPWGAQWYEYSLRRLRENPRVAGHIANDVLGGMARRLRITGRRGA